MQGCLAACEQDPQGTAKAARLRGLHTGEQVVGGGRCPIVDTWWQTETGSIAITPLPGAWATLPGCATLPFFGIAPVILDDKVGPCLHVGF